MSTFLLSINSSSDHFNVLRQCGTFDELKILGKAPSFNVNFVLFAQG